MLITPDSPIGASPSVQNSYIPGKNTTDIGTPPHGVYPILASDITSTLNVTHCP